MTDPSLIAWAISLKAMSSVAYVVVMVVPVPATLASMVQPMLPELMAQWVSIVRRFWDVN